METRHAVVPWPMRARGVTRFRRYWERRCKIRMASKLKGSGSKGKYRSAISGRYVTKKHGERSPRTTVRETK